ncbi:MAG: SDR family NAD(P)-dependent oxidoreductase [Deltaproteobacteria bacterium]|nr:SDR family NAD(P)-dependent oxidoreductase [Deltaproteobacteria bacterium]
MSERRVAFVTGASRGIGAASALALAEKGYDVVVTARTVVEGQSADGRPLPGSIETTAAGVRARGREALGLRLDLLDRKSIHAALDRTLSEWGQIDLLLNNGIYTGPGSMDLFLDLDLSVVETMFQANLFAQIDLTQRVLTHMLERGRGIVINMVSGAGLGDPPAPANRGGWGYAYAATKAAFHRMIGVLAVEHRNTGVRFHNIEPGFVMTEAMKLNDPDGAISKQFQPAPPEVPAAAIAWLASDPAAIERSGETLYAQKLCLELGLHPDWRRPA